MPDPAYRPTHTDRGDFEMRVVVWIKLAVVLWSAPALAFVVDSTVDAPDATPGDGLCATTADQCTLRAAVEEANASPGLDFVQLEAKHYPLAIPAELAVTDDIQIFSPGLNAATIDG